MTGQTPPDTVIYAIGDIHGRDDLLAAIHDQIASDVAGRSASQRQVVYLGDYVSRGAASRRVVDRVLAWLPDDFTRVTLKGNHEDLLLRFLAGDLEAGSHWFDYGGLDTLAGYGVAIAHREARDSKNVAALRDQFEARLPPAHLAFFQSLRISHRAGDYCFVHAGVRPGVPLARQEDHDQMWIRRAFLDSDADHGAIIVHGHCISSRPEIRPNRIGIDTGASQSGVLTCLVLDGATAGFLHT